MSTLNDAINQFEADAALAHEIVNGDANTVVETDGGSVRSFAKLQGDFLNQTIVATYAALPVQPRGLFIVLADETKGGSCSVYFFTPIHRIWFAAIQEV